jgi:hypothetical protein
MSINRPTRVVFIISTVLAVLALISRFIATLPIVGGYEFFVLFLAYLLLWLGVTLRGF